MKFVDLRKNSCKIQNLVDDFKVVIYIMINFLMKICRFNFGKFEEKEFRKFLRMGIIFMLTIGIYWSLRPLKDSLFSQLAGAINLPYAKTISLIFMIPFVALYTNLLDRFKKEKLLTVMPCVYGVVISLYAIFVWLFQKGAIQPSVITKMMGYVWYWFVESFGSVVVALFWSFSTDVTRSNSAKQGFPLVVALGQIGGIIAPYLLINLPVAIGIRYDSVSMIILAVLTFLYAPLIRNLLSKTPGELMNSGVETKSKEKEKKEETGFMGGIKLLFTQKYLLGIFAVNLFFEFIVTIFDFNFKLLASTRYSGVELTQYLSFYSSVVNTASLICLLLGISKVAKKLGIGISLAVMPLLLGLAVFGFYTIHSLSFFLYLMVFSKAINYALNGPTLKQLYIPTSQDARSKSQAWIETFGSRISKEAGSGANMLIKPLGKSGYMLFSVLTSGIFIAAWFFIALFLGRTCKKATDSNNIVC
ncbi:MAG: ATP/ADP translocase [Candidatus Improbicoccus pseudotrichonymphae]|uniref:ADP,ATP carrier protein n=1 Tax=Candidatus Improbicoccus pseudotrichonymphae TaxID=3033792 RepID=A0AA48KYE7_9FIRM|nr:MAG: ATP/ADP translocase [Candidatus Improbicoccus pseudotrichonymphae]